MSAPEHRAAGYAWLKGTGLEVGALHEPAVLPAECVVEYFDVIDAAEAARRFPEIDPARLVTVNHLGDLDHDGLAQFDAGHFDFVIMSHVLEHVANPIRVIEEAFRITRPGGMVVLTIPDKDYTFDRPRAITPFAHLWDDYCRNVRENSDEHYLDFLRFVGPHVFAEPPENLPGHLQWVRGRREHAHVWDSAACRAFLHEALARLRIPARLRHESNGAENRIEYFSVWEKRADPVTNS